LHVLDADATSNLLDYADMISDLKQACMDLEEGRIQAPERQMVEFPGGGTMLSMPATAPDIGIHKLVNVMRDNPARNLPTIHGVVAVYDGITGAERCILHGQTITARRTAAVSMLGLDMLLPRPPRHVAIVGYGTQALSHTQAVARLYPDARVTITGRNLSRADHFVEKNKDIGVKLAAAARIPEDADVVITVTTSSTAFYEQTATTGRLIVAVGAFRPDMAEISAQTLDGSQLYVDDMVGARTEAGDLLQASIDWTRVRGIVDAVRHGVDFDRPIVYKTVGCAAWDLAAARTALNCLQAR
ncbi:MAG TPA: delta(1)-pyrroline-2-carboxylate reductase family protein, partial [Burkholderiaceae bacterium]|nr:delta(1)-pyrroline-2-carboxylate reductase family protein [Burkholderiaceae bacterium]